MQAVFLPKLLLLLLHYLPPQDSPAPRGGLQPSPLLLGLQGSSVVMQSSQGWGVLIHNLSKDTAVKELCGSVLGVAGLSFCDCQDEKRQWEAQHSIQLPVPLSPHPPH